jgi:hypothetical protein
MSSHLLIEYRAPDGETTADAHSDLSLTALIKQAANGWDILSISLIEITPAAIVATDLSKDAAKIVMDLYGDDEGGITDEWDMLFHRAGYNLEAINGDAAAEAVEYCRYERDRAADYRAAVL